MEKWKNTKRDGRGMKRSKFSEERTDYWYIK
jgi:hypothetical protein